MIERDPDPDLVRETVLLRRACARARQRRLAWDEPPDFYDPPLCERCGEELTDFDGQSDGCRDPRCPAGERRVA